MEIVYYTRRHDFWEELGFIRDEFIVPVMQGLIGGSGRKVKFTLSVRQPPPPTNFSFLRE